MILKKENHFWGFIFLVGYFIGYIFVINWLSHIFSKEIQLSSSYNTTLIIGNLGSLAITCLLIFYELKPFSTKKTSLFTTKGEKLIYIPRFDMFISIFECNSLSNIYIEGLSLLTGLNRYSIELDEEIKRLRIFFYSNSNTELSKIIEEAKPLLETIFPNLTQLSVSSLASDFHDYSLRKRGEFLHIKQGHYLIIPQIGQKIEFDGLKDYTHILNYNSHKDPVIKSSSTDSTQFYSFNRFRESSFFDFFGKICYSDGIPFFTDDIDDNILYRAIIRYKLIGFSSISDVDGVIKLQQKLTNFIEESSGFENSKIFYPQQHVQISKNADTYTFSSKDQEFNQICKELCNITRSSVGETNRMNNCKKRSSFCKKLLINQNFNTFLGELVDGEDGKRKDTILSNLLRHVSFHQIYCVLAQFITSYDSDNLDEEITKLIQLVIQKQLDMSRLEESPEKNHLSVGNLHQRLDHSKNFA